MASKPKVLWFTNTPSLAEGFLNIPVIGGGWIKSLEEHIKNTESVCLAVAFEHGNEKLNKFDYRNTTYYGIPNNSSRVKKLIHRHVGKLNDEQLLKYCLEIIDDFEPDIINIFGTESGFGLLIDRTNIPVVIHLQGILTVYQIKWFPAHINKLHLLRHSNIKELLKGESLVHSYNYLRAAACRERQIFKMCKFFMGRTDWDRRITTVLARDAAYFQSNELLRTEFYKNSWKKKPGDFKILISTIQANIYKGLETILESALLLKKVNKFHFSWIVAGISNSDVLIKIFEKKIGKKFTDYNIVFVGKLGVEDLVKMELEADIFIHPSHIDNSPNSVCEAMLLGMPVIVTNTGGTASLLTDQREGIVIQDGDPYSLAGAIVEMLNDPAYSAELGKNARERAIERHDPDRVVNNLLDIYSEILGKSRWSVNSAATQYK